MNIEKRCPWGAAGNELMRQYHDTQWGKPCFEERELFEMLILEGAQAGLSWACVLNKRENYADAFDCWEVEKIAAYNQKKIEQLMHNDGIIRNKLKINAAITNARAVQKLGSLKDFFWKYVDEAPIINHPENQTDVAITTPLSDKISKDMKKLGFKFVGSTIIYSYMQAIGMVNDHLDCCSFK